MTENTTPYKSVKKSKIANISYIWLIPIFTTGIGLYLLVQHQLQKGPTITLIFDQAEDISSNKTEIRALNIKIGTITNIRLSDDYKKIIATAQLDSQASRMVREDTLFWVVKPRIDREGVIGLSTLLSVVYIEMQPGVKKKKNYRFKVLDSPPVAEPDAKGLRLILTNSQSGKLNIGDPVYFKGFVVGRIETMSLDMKKNYVVYQLFIYAPYNHLIYENTNFWIKKAFDVTISGKGVHLEMGSIEDLFLGGVTFGVESGEKPGKQITSPLHKFTLYDSKSQIKQASFRHYPRFIMFFDESIKGLNNMASIEYRGIKIGAVIKAPYKLKSPLDWPEKPIPVLVSINLDSINSDSPSIKSAGKYSAITEMFEQGLRASLSTSNILTGQLSINLDFYSEEKSYTAENFKGFPVFPTRPSSFTQIQKEVNTFLNYIKKIKIDKSVNNINDTLLSARKFMSTGRKLLHDLDTIVDSGSSKQLPESINSTLKSIREALNKFDENSLEYQSLRQSLLHLNDVLMQLNPLLQQLNQQPNALIFKSSTSSDVIPKGRQQ